MIWGLLVATATNPSGNSIIGHAAIKAFGIIWPYLLLMLVAGIVLRAVASAVNKPRKGRRR